MPACVKTAAMLSLQCGLDLLFCFCFAFLQLDKLATMAAPHTRQVCKSWDQQGLWQCSNSSTTNHRQARPQCCLGHETLGGCHWEGTAFLPSICVIIRSSRDLWQCHPRRVEPTVPHLHRFCLPLLLACRLRFFCGCCCCCCSVEAGGLCA